MGPSGSGKSTLLNVLGCLDRPTSGEYYLGDEDVAGMDDNQLSEIRSLYLGFIFQSYNLLPQYTLVENIEIPLLYQGRPLGAATRERCIELAGMVGLGDRLGHRPTAPRRFEHRSKINHRGTETQRMHREDRKRKMSSNVLVLLCESSVSLC